MATITCLSFPSRPLPYEFADLAAVRPDICIGTDEFHTPPGLARAFVAVFEREGWRVSLDDPFAGALVPASRYRVDHRVFAVMVEVNRSLYLNEANAAQLPHFEEVAQRIRHCCAIAIRSWHEEGVP